MVSKKNLLKNLSRYSAEEIAEAVRAEVVTFYELSKETQGAFGPLLEKRVRELVEHPPIPSACDGAVQVEADAVRGSAPVPCPDQDAEVKAALQTSMAKAKQVDNRGMFERPFSFKGRIRRLEYVISLFYLVSMMSVACIMLCGHVGVVFGVVFSVVFYVLAFVLEKWFWLFWLVGMMSAACISLCGDEGGVFGSALGVISLVLAAWFGLAQGCKRCHDLGRSGWFQIIPLYVLVMLFAGGDKGENIHGNNPKKD